MQQTALTAGTIKPKVDAYGNVIGFEEVGSDEKFIPVQRGVFSTRDRKIIEGTEPQPQADFSDRRKFQQDRNKTFNDATGEPIYTADNYYRTTYDEQGNLRKGAEVVPVIEQHLDYLNEFARQIGMREEPFRRAGQAAAPPAGDESAQEAMSLAEFIEDFKQDSGKEPTPEQIAAAQGRFWR
jgi:hypothetical protein